MIKGILLPDGLSKDFFQPRIPDLFRNHEIIGQQDVSLGFLRVGAEAEPLDFLHEQSGNSQNIDIENGMFGDGAVPQTENDSPVGLPRLFYFLPATARSSWTGRDRG
jgi:hypothetical protein